MLTSSKKNKIPTGEAACRLADELAEELHPIWGHRSKEIIKSLIYHYDWANQKN